MKEGITFRCFKSAKNWICLSYVSIFTQTVYLFVLVENLVSWKMSWSWGVVEQISKSPSRRGLQKNHAQLHNCPGKSLVKFSRRQNFKIIILNFYKGILRNSKMSWLKASEARLTLPAMCRVEHQKRNQVAAERERASHTKQKIWAKPSKQQSKARKLKYPPEFWWGPVL